MPSQQLQLLFKQQAAHNQSQLETVLEALFKQLNTVSSLAASDVNLTIDANSQVSGTLGKLTVPPTRIRQLSLARNTLTLAGSLKAATRHTFTQFIDALTLLESILTTPPENCLFPIAHCTQLTETTILQTSILNGYLIVDVTTLAEKKFNPFKKLRTEFHYRGKHVQIIDQQTTNTPFVGIESIFELVRLGIALARDSIAKLDALDSINES